MAEYQFCPLCTSELEYGLEHVKVCPNCEFVHYDNPVPVVACLVPIEDKIVLVQRGAPPFIGQWCLPCGFMNRHEHPKAAAARETKEETGLIVRLEQILSACNPSPEDYPLNQLVIHYLGRVVGGTLQAGDDAQAVRLFQKDELPNICFRSHRMIIDEWFKGTWGILTGVDL